MDKWQARTYLQIQARLDEEVPPVIRQLIECGGPTRQDSERVSSYATVLGEHGDTILYDEKDITEEAMGKLVEGVAILSFCQGGVSAFGLRFDAHEIRVRMRQSAVEAQAGRSPLKS